MSNPNKRKGKYFEDKITKDYQTLFNLNKINLDQQQAHVILDGVIDFFEGYTNGNDLNSNCRSSDIFSKVATKYNLSSDIDRTNDQQLWIAGQKNIYQKIIHF